MRLIAVVFLVCALCTRILAETEGRASSAASTQPSTAPAPFAVVELFTSEGCSSCPPADRVLAKIVADSRRTGRRVFPIAFHVDYWDRLGWKDRFSSATHSARQSQYASAFRLDSIYTPQMVVNGSVEFNGSDSARAAKEIDVALKQPANTSIAINSTLKPSKGIEVHYQLVSPPDDMVLNVVAVERGLETAVARGENKGQRLRHENVARAWSRIAHPSEQGNVELKLPADAGSANVQVIAYLQSTATMKVIAVTSLDVSSQK